MMNMQEITNLSIDASTVCQLKCPECSTTKGIIKNGIIRSGFLKFNIFRDFIEKNHQIKQIELSNWGEIFLNPEIIDIIKFCHYNGIKLTAGNGTNFNKVADDVLEALVKYKFAYINISIDGASQESYVKYRINGDYDEVISNIKRLNYYKSKYDSQYPKLSWQFIIFGHNEHELPQIKTLCQELNMVFYPRLNHSTFSPLINKEFVREESGLNVATRDEYKAKFNKAYKRPCCQLMYSPQVNWNGDLLGCCVNKWKSFGNAFKEGLSNCLNNDLYTQTISVLFGKENVTEEMPCFKCPTYADIKNNPISEEEIYEYAAFIHPAEKI
jgi:MoaA/NifB/PqqE/SkfB family radical SAM enzyme